MRWCIIQMQKNETSAFLRPSLGQLLVKAEDIVMKKLLASRYYERAASQGIAAAQVVYHLLLDQMIEQESRCCW
jgi:hypothetical protein